MAVTPNSMVLPQGFRSVACTVTAANSTFTGSAAPANAALLCTAGTNGSIIRRLKAYPLYASGSTAFTATMAQLLKLTGGAIFLDDAASLIAQTLALTVAPTPADFGYSDSLTRYLPPGASFYAGIGVAWAPGVTFTADIADL